jgi:hypothetical protein
MLPDGFVTTKVKNCNMFYVKAYQTLRVISNNIFETWQSGDYYPVALEDNNMVASGVLFWVGNENAVSAVTSNPNLTESNVLYAGKLDYTYSNYDSSAFYNVETVDYLIESGVLE